VAKVRYSRLARKDLLDIWQHIELRTSEAAADGICDRIEDACRVLTDYPQLGRARPEKPTTRDRWSSSAGLRFIDWFRMACRS
jgi:toxin ParE1/3/4